MAIALEQSGSNGGDNDFDIDIGSQATEDNLLVACIFTRGSNKPSITGFSEAVSVNNTSKNDWLWIATKLATSSEPSTGVYTVVVDADQAAGWIGEYSGLLTTGFLDVTASEAQTTEADKDSGTTATTAQADELAIAAFAARSNATRDTYTNSFTERGNYNHTSGNIAEIWVADKTLTATGTQTTQLQTVSGTHEWLAAIITLKAESTQNDETGSDSATLSEAKTMEADPDRSDDGSLSEDPVTLEQGYTGTDDGTLTSSSDLEEAVAKTGSDDTLTLDSETSDLEEALAVVGSDSATLGETVIVLDREWAAGVEIANLAEALNDRVFSAAEQHALAELIDFDRGSGEQLDSGSLAETSNVYEVAQPSFPTEIIEVAFGYTPNAATYVWTDITEYVRGWRSEIGRDWEQEYPKAGKATFTLDNRDRRFEPGNTGSPYSPNVVGKVPIRVRATYDGTTYDVWLGLIENWPQQYPGLKDNQVKVKAVQAYNLLIDADTTTTFSSEAAGTRIGNLLDDANWPATRRSLAAGTTMLSHVPYCASVLEEIMRVVDTDDGLFFIDQAGVATYQAGTYRSGLTSSATFGDDIAGGDLPFHAIKYTPDDVRNVFNSISVIRLGGTEQNASDTASQTSHGIQWLKRFDTLHTSDANALTLANTLLARYKDPHNRVESIGILPARLPASLWPVLLGLDISDIITVERNPDGGTAFSVDCHIEAIEHRAIRGRYDWSVTLHLSPA